MSDPIADLKHELLAAAERQYRHTAAPEQSRRSAGRVFTMRPLLVAATVTVAAAAALFVAVPWSSSPSFLAQAEAALTAPSGTILYVKSTETVASTDPIACTSSVRSRKRVTWTPESWVDERTQRWRGRYRDPFFRELRRGELKDTPCMPGRAYEAGSIPVPDYLTGYWSGAVRFVPPNELVASPILRVPAPDPVGAVRRAIRDGRAHAEGRTELNGRTVEHIRFDPCRSHNSPCGPGADAYVDPGTFYPVEIDLPARRGLPRDVTRFTAFEYLPRTAANLALTSIRAQHPHASGPSLPGTIELPRHPR